MGDQFPMFRLATLLARQLSSPIAARIKAYATEHPWFRRALIERAGRVYRAGELRLKLWLLHLGRPPRTPPLSAAEAANVGADIIGEVIVFTLGAVIVIFEVNRQAMNKELKELDELSRWVAVGASLEELQREVALQQRDLERLSAALRALAPHAFPAHPTHTPPPPTHTPPPPTHTPPPPADTPPSSTDTPPTPADTPPSSTDSPPPPADMPPPKSLPSLKRKPHC